MQIERQAFYEPEDILSAVQDKVKETRKAGERIDYLTFVPDGEPTLDINLKQEIDLLKPLNIPIAVITNSSLVWQQEVRKALMEANLVSLKLDTVEEAGWHRVNRPHRGLKLASIIEAVLEFAHSFQGKLITETMILSNVNDTDQHFNQVANFLAHIQPIVVYLSIPTRPPAEEWAQPPGENVINRAYQILNEKVEHVEYLTGYEGNAFAFTGNVEEDLLSITAVHPMRDDAVEALIKRAGVDWAIIRRMVMAGQVIETEYTGHKFYLRRFRKHYGEKN